MKHKTNIFHAKIKLYPVWKPTLANPVWQVISGEYTDGTILTLYHFPPPPHHQQHVSVE